jgi:hypothetical protein
MSELFEARFLKSRHVVLTLGVTAVVAAVLAGPVGSLLVPGGLGVFGGDLTVPLRVFVTALAGLAAVQLTERRCIELERTAQGARVELAQWLTLLTSTALLAGAGAFLGHATGGAGLAGARSAVTFVGLALLLRVVLGQAAWLPGLLWCSLCVVFGSDGQTGVRWWAWQIVLSVDGSWWWCGGLTAAGVLAVAATWVGPLSRSSGALSD